MRSVIFVLLLTGTVLAGPGSWEALEHGPSAEVPMEPAVPEGDAKKLIVMVGPLMTDVEAEANPGAGRPQEGVATDVLGYLVELISGIPLDEYFRTRIFEPLGMVDTGFSVPPEKIDRFAANYTRGRDKKPRLEDDPATSDYAKPATFFSGNDCSDERRSNS